jgi:signal transduction histidine kinase
VIERAEAGKLDFQPSSLDIVGFCGDSIEQMQLALESKHKLTCVSQAHRIATCMNEKLLRHTLANLLSNAIEYSFKGGQIAIASAIGVGTTVTATLSLNSSSQIHEEDSGN